MYLKNATYVVTKYRETSHSNLIKNTENRRVIKIYG